MALKVLLLRKQLENKRRELADLTAKDADFAKREAEMEAAIDEITSDEQVSTVQEAVDCLRTEMDAHQAAKTELERAVTELEGEIAQEEAAQETEQPKNEKEHGKDEDNMNDIRENTAGMAVRDRLAQIVTRDDGSIHWRITEVNLFEVSVCTFPAYEATSVSAREAQRDALKAKRLEEVKDKLKGVLHHGA